MTIAIPYKNKYRISSTRRPGYEYATPEFYFITLCTKNRKNYFKEILNNKMIGKELSLILQICWDDLPNHIHFILELIRISSAQTGLRPASKYHISKIIRAFKSFSSRRINELKGPKYFSWQRDYYERIIRDEDELKNVRKYIKNNPLTWEKEKYY